MGVPKFFRWISERYPCLSEIVREYQIPTFDNLYLDMNGIIHTCSHPNDFDPHFRITEEKIFKDIFHYIEILFRMIRPQKLFFMAVDGVAPRAKMNQQRGRRFRSAKEADTLEKKAQEKGEILPDEERFDSNCITPGTIFMARLHEQLKYFVTYKVSTDPLWQKCKVILSGHETPGEGEHKIMDYIRFMKSKPDYDPNTRHCLYGLDADLVMLGLCSHEPHFSLLREEVKFVRTKQKRSSTPEEQKFFLLHLSLLREYLELEFQVLKTTIPFPFDIEKIIDDWVLMGFLVGNDFIPPLPDMHIANGALPILYEAYIQVLPNLGGYINEGGKLNLERFQKYMEKLSAFDIEQFRETYADLKYFEGKTGRKIGAKERTSYKNKDSEESTEVAKLSDILALLKTADAESNAPTEATSDSPPNSTNEVTENNPGTSENEPPASEPEKLKDESKSENSGRKNVNPDLEALIKETEDLLMGDSSSCQVFDDEDYEDDEEDYDDDDDDDSERDDENFFMEFYQHKRDYYMNKLEYSIVNEEVLRSQAEGYVRAIQWNLNYYYNGVCSWSWFYPHHYAPYISDIRNFSHLQLDFSMGTPFLPFQQLLAVLPSASKKLLPEPYQALMINSESPIINYYPSQFKTDLNGKKQEWEAVVLIPFIDETVLLKAMEPINKRLTAEEQKRNSHGPALIYEYSEEDFGTYNSPEYFPDLSNNHAKMTELWREDLNVDPTHLVKGLCVGAQLDVYFPGFPTLKHIKHSASLEKKKVKVFEMPSRGDNMILKIINDLKPDVKDVAEELLGKSIFVDWPHLLEAKVIAVTSKQKRYFLSQDVNPDSLVKENCMQEEEVKGNMVSVWISQKNGIQERYLNRLGIDVGPTEILVQGTPIVGRKFMFDKKSRITIEKHWSKHPVTYALQATVRNIKVHDASYAHDLELYEFFPPGTRIFLLGLPHYGYMGEVRDYEEGSLRAGRVKITITVTVEPFFGAAREKHMNVRVNYMPGGVAAGRLGISAHLLSRITGTIYIVHGDWSEGSESKTNVGLNLKFNKRNEEVPGYTKKDNGMWLYSYKAVELVGNYMQAFPKLFDYLGSNTGNDIFNDTEIFPDPKESLAAISNWLKEQPFYKIERQVCGAAVFDPEIVQEVETIVDNFYQTKHSVKNVSMQVKPHLLFKPSMQSGSLPPDPEASYLLFDRVVNIRESYTVPLGWKGTIIGIHKGEKDADTMYDVLFDKPFAGGMSINSSENRGYRVPCYALINLSHGERLAQEKSDQKSGLPSAGKTSFSNNNAYMFSPAWNSAQQQPQIQIQTQQSQVKSFMQQHPKQDQNQTKIKQQMFPVTGPGPVPLAHQTQNVVSSHPNSAFASWRSQTSVPATNKPPFGTSMHSPQALQASPSSQGGVKGTPSWRQRPQQPPPTQLLQRQPPLFRQQPLMQPPLMQQPPPPPPQGPLQMLMNSAPNPLVQLAQGGKSPQKQLQTLPNTSSPSEFQLMWSELQGITKPSGDPVKNIPPPSQSNAPLEVNDSGTEILKKMLRIAEASAEKPLPISSPPQNMKQVSVQEMFEHARASESKGLLPEENPCTMQLFKFFQMQGLPVPRYTYSENKDDKSVTAKVILPNMQSYCGASASSKEKASENAAKVALSQINMKRTGNVNSNVGFSGSRPLTNNLPSPPQNWCWPQNQQQLPPQQQQRPNRYPEFPQNKSDWRNRSDHVGPFASNTQNMWVRQQSSQLPAPHYSCMMPQQQVRTPPRTNWRDDSSRQGSQFVPLQAVKQQRSKSGVQQQLLSQSQQQQQQQSQQQKQSSHVQQMQQIHQQQQQPLQLQPQWQSKTKVVSTQQQPKDQQKTKQSFDNAKKSPGKSANPNTKSKENKSSDLSKTNIARDSSKSKANGNPMTRQKKSRIAANFGGSKVPDQS